MEGPGSGDATLEPPGPAQGWREVSLSLMRCIADLQQRVDALEKAQSQDSDYTVAEGPLQTSCPGKDGDALALQGEPEREEDPGTDEHALEYSMGESVWEAAFLVGLSELGLARSAVLLVATIINAAVQLYIIAVLLMDEEFSSTDKLTGLLPFMRRWRLNVAHALKEMDASGFSLASRVCGTDESLSVAANQASLLGEINHYLGLSPGELEASGLGSGPLLCTVCLFLFTVLMLAEIRTAVTCLLSFGALPRSVHTSLQDNGFVTISTSRLAFVLLITAVRLVVAVALLHTGLIWLSTTSSTTDIILNTAALSFVMDLDDYLFTAAVPARVQAFVSNLKPLQYRGLRYNLEATLPLVASVVIVITAYSTLLNAHASQLLEVKSSLCGGNLNFVVTQNPAGWNTALETQQYVSEQLLAQDFTPDFMEAAVQELRDRVSGNTKMSFSNFYVESRHKDFVREADMTLAKSAEGMLCEDMDWYAGGIFQQSFPAYFMAIRVDTGLHRDETIRQRPFHCTEQAEFCQTSGLLRNHCPMTCGCADPTSGLLFNQPKMGCATTCTQKVPQPLLCSDMAVAGNANWTRYWRAYEAFMVKSIGQQYAPLYRNFTTAKINGGCNDTALDPKGQFGFCDSSHAFFTGNGVGAITGFCPSTCCSGPGPRPPGCPSAC